jgi:flagellar FliL protein
MDALLPLILLIVFGAVVVGAIVVMIMRRRRAEAEVIPPPELSQPIDYTSLPVEEPTSFGDRVRNAPMATKLLVGVIALAVVVGLGVFYFIFFGGEGSTAGAPTPVVPPRQITEVKANVAGPTKILIDASTDLQNGAVVTATMQEDGQPFDWFNPRTASVQVNDGRIRMIVERQSGAPVPKQNAEYTIVLASQVPGGLAVSSQPTKVDVPKVYQAAFFQVPTPTVAPPPTPTVPPTPGPTTVVTPTAAPTPTVEGLAATVFNGGNVREQPSLGGRVLDQINAGETVQLLEKSADGQWYRITNIRSVSGWVSRSLLTVDPQVAARVPIQGQSPPTAPPAPGTPVPTFVPSGLTGTVFNGGNVREQPSLGGRVLDQINAGETVQLLGKSADGQWYRITNIRSVTGWVSRSLLTIDPQVAAQVPVTK